jgi:hypothetical protein
MLYSNFFYSFLLFNKVQRLNDSYIIVKRLGIALQDFPAGLIGNTCNHNTQPEFRNYFPILLTYNVVNGL